MGEYADVKRRKILKLLKWLSKKEHLIVSTAAEHQWVIRHSNWSRPYPIPFKHGTVSKHYIKDLMKKLVKSEVCTKEEFNKYVK